MLKTGSLSTPEHLQGGERTLDRTEFQEAQDYVVVPIRSRRSGQVTKLVVRLKNATSGRIVRGGDGV